MFAVSIGVPELAGPFIFRLAPFLSSIVFFSNLRANFLYCDPQADL